MAKNASLANRNTVAKIVVELEFVNMAKLNGFALIAMVLDFVVTTKTSIHARYAKIHAPYMVSKIALRA